MEESTSTKAAFDLSKLSGETINTEIIDRTFAIQLAQLAVELAQQAGEEVRRPLADHQIARALDVNIQERDTMFVHLAARWDRMRNAGILRGYREPESPQEPASQSN